MSLAKQALQALGKVGIIIAVGVAFLFGMAGTVYLSLRSAEVKVPEIVGKDRLSAEAALNDVGLNLRQRATRYSADAQPNTILDQSPKAGEVIKIGQTVAVVLSRAAAREGETSTPLSTAEEKKPGTDKSQEQNKNANTSTSANNSNANQNQNNQNKEKRIKNSNNKNANNSNNSNASNRNANNANNRNANTGGNVNAVNSNANANSSPGNANNSNANKRAPVNISTPPFNPTTSTP